MPLAKFSHRGKSPGMTLEDWRREQRFTFDTLGKKYGVGPALAYQHCQPMGQRHAKLPSPKVMKRIVKMTLGAVTPNDFYRPLIPTLAAA